MSAVNGPRPFAFGDAPEPAGDLVPVEDPEVIGAATHTGTDPYGRAVGPAEDHTVPKVDSEGHTVLEAAGIRAAKKAAAKKTTRRRRTS